MPLAIAAALLAGDAPRRVQVNVTGLTIGEPYTVTASAGSWSRVVQGGDGVEAASTQAVLVDVATPLNVDIDWTVTHDGATATTSTPVEVPYTAADAVICSLDGAQVAGIFWDDNNDPRDIAPRGALYSPAGRSRPVLHYDVAEAETGVLVVETSGADTTTLRDLVLSGAPVLVRTMTGLRDIDPVDVVAITAAPRTLIGASSVRRWTLTVVSVDDPDDVALAAATLADVNTEWSGLFLDDVNTLWSGQTLADLNVFDWGA